MKKTNYSYIGIAFIILVFGIIFIPRIVDRISNEDIIRNESRSDLADDKKSGASDLAFIEINGVPKKVPSFSFTNHNGETITDEDYLGKVYVLEFFFTTCPTICPRMNKNLIQIQNTFDGFEDFGVASFTINPLIDKKGFIRSRKDDFGNPIIYYRGITSEEEKVDDDGTPEEISALKADIKKLLNE